MTSVRPKRIFSRKVSSNNKASWVTTENRPRKSSSAISDALTPPILTVPDCGSTKRVNRLKIVDLPAPEAPTNAVVCPGSATSDRLCRTVVSPYAKVTLPNVTSGVSVGAGFGFSAEASVTGASSNSFTRSIAAAAICQRPLMPPKRRKGSKAKPMAVKNVMNWPIVFSPAMISEPP